MNATPLLSIMIPFYARDDRRNALINEALHTLPDDPRLEIIIVDDRSPVPLCIHASLKHTRLCITQTPYQSDYAGAARNHAMRQAKGRFLLHADSDDLFDQNQMCLLLDFLETAPQDRTVHLLGTRRFTTSLDRKDTAPVYDQVRDPHSSLDTLRRLCIWHAPWGKVFSQDMLPALHNTFKENDVVDDCLFSVNLALLATRHAVVPGVHYYWRKEENHESLTSSLSPSLVSARIAAQREVNTILQKRGRPDAIPAMLHLFKGYIRSYPFTVLKEMFFSFKHKEKVFPTHRAIIQKAKKHISLKRGEN